MRQAWHSVLIRPALLIGFIGLFSKGLQALAGVFFAHSFGANATTDAYLLAKSLPIGAYLLLDNLLYNALTSLYGDRAEGEYRRLFTGIAIGTICAASLLAGGLWLIAPVVLTVIAPGADEATRTLAAGLCRLMCVAVVLLAPASTLKAWNTCRRRYVLGALDAALMSGVLLAALATGPGQWGIWSVAVALPAASMLLLVLQIAACWKDRPWAAPRRAWRFAGKFFRLMGPLVAFNALHQVNVLGMNAFLTLSKDGAVSWLNFSYNVVQIPVSVVDVVVLSTFFPWSVSLDSARGREDFREAFATVLGMLIAVLAPAGVWLALMRREVIGVVFEHGRFGADATAGASDCLLWLALGMVFWAGETFTYRCLFALQGHSRYALIMGGRVLLNLLLCSFLAKSWGHDGVALSFAISYAAGATASVGAVLRRFGGWRYAAVLAKSLVSALAAACAVGATHFAVGGLTEGASPFEKVLVSGTFSALVVLFIYSGMLLWRRQATR